MDRTLNWHNDRAEHNGVPYEITIYNFDGGNFTIEVHVEGLPRRADNDNAWESFDDAVAAAHELARGLIE